MPDERCPPTGKVCYASKQAAWKVIEDKRQRHGPRHSTELRRKARGRPKGNGTVGAYQCPHCKFFHISSSTGGHA